MSDNDLNEKLKQIPKFVMLGLLEPGKTIDQIESEVQRKYPGNEKEINYRSKSIWHNKKDLDDFVQKKLGLTDQEASKQYPSGGESIFYKSIANEISKLRENKTTTDWNSDSRSGIWRMTYSNEIPTDEPNVEIINVEVNQSDPNNTVRFFIALGPWSNWDHTMKNPPFRWGVNPSSASNVGVFNALRPGDIVYFYANQDPPTQFSNRGLFGVGKVIRKYDESNEFYWPDEKLKGEVIYKHRFEIESLKMVKSNSELLPWIDGLPFTKGLNRIANPETLQQLIDNTQKIWNIDLKSAQSSINYWKISPGEAGEDWQNQKSRGLIGIHFFDFDLTGLSENELREKIQESYGPDGTPTKRTNTFGQMRDFMSIKEGDIIVANLGKSKILGIGQVKGPYRFRKDEKHPHTFPVDWYDTTEGTIPKQDGWMITVIKLNKTEFENLTTLRINYLLLRHSPKLNRWDDSIGKKYHFGKIPNYTKLVPGANTIWYDRQDGDFYYWGYGDITKVENESEDRFNALFDNFTYFNEPTKENPGTLDIIPRKSPDSIKQKIMNLPGWNNQISMLPITKEIYDEIVSGEEKSKTFEDTKLSLLTPAEIKAGYEKIKEELLIPEEKITEIVTALASGRHLLLAGPIGTGKTRLAKIIPEIFWDKVGGYYSEDHTATADWSTQDVIGGIFPKMEEDGKPIYDIQNGCVVDTVRKNWENGINGGMRIPMKHPTKNSPYKGTWLIIDEFNRADIDKAFGQLFTALRTKWLKIPTDKKGVSYKNLKIPEDYRIIGTLNTADKHFLFQLSDALKSRFAYIEIDIPKKDQWEKEIYYAIKNALDELDLVEFDKLVLDDKNKRINKEKSDIDFYNRVMQAYSFLDTVRVFKKLGTAILKLIYQNLIVGTIMTENSKISLDNALTSNLIPQLENLSVTFVSAIHALHSDTLVLYLKDAYKSPNRQSYVESLGKILDYLQIQTKLVSEFANGNIKIENDDVWKPIQTAYDNKKKDYELGLDQIKQSMDDLIKSMVI